MNKRLIPKKVSGGALAPMLARNRVSVLGAARHSVITAIQNAFLKRNTWLEIGILLTAGAVSALTLYQLLLQKPNLAKTPTLSENQQLVTSVIDDLELWIEERQTTYLTPTVIPSRVFENTQ